MGNRTFAHLQGITLSANLTYWLEKYSQSSSSVASGTVSVPLQWILDSSQIYMLIQWIGTRAYIPCFKSPLDEQNAQWVNILRWPSCLSQHNFMKAWVKALSKSFWFLGSARKDPTTIRLAQTIQYLSGLELLKSHSCFIQLVSNSPTSCLYEFHMFDLRPGHQPRGSH
jgi:hypothetical protein